MATLTATLDSAISLQVRESAELSRVLSDLLTVKRGAYGVPRVVSVGRSQTRTLRLPIVLKGTDIDDLLGQVDAINEVLAKATTLLLTPTGAANSITFRTYPSPSIDVPTPRHIRSGVLLCEIELVCEPYAYGSETTLLSAVTALPAAIDLSAMAGSYETPLEASFALSNMTQIILGLIEEEYDWSGWLLDANTLGWDAGGNAADGNAYGGAARKATGGVKMGASIAVTDFPRGEYALWVRARMSSGSGLLYCNTIGSSKAVTLTNTAYEWHDLGRLVCPTRHTYGAGTASTSIFIDPDGTSDGWVDRIAFVRAAAGYLAYDGDAVDSFATDGEHAFIDGRSDYEEVRGSALYALRGKLCAIVETDGASGPTLSPTVVLNATSRHGLWR